MGKRIEFTQQEAKWLQKQYKKQKTTKSLVTLFNETFGANRSYDTIRHKVRSFGMTRKSNITSEQDEWLTSIVKGGGVTWRDIAAEFEKKFKQKRSADTIRVHCRDSLGLVLMQKPADANYLGL